MKDGWDLTTMGVAQSWSALEDLENIDFVSVGLTEEDRVSMINQLNVLAASFIWMVWTCLVVCLYTSTKEGCEGLCQMWRLSILSTPCWMYLC